jgi:hypothetical protein
LFCFFFRFFDGVGWGPTLVSILVYISRFVVCVCFVFPVRPIDRCALFCHPMLSASNKRPGVRLDLYYPLKDKVIDGTPCGLDTFDVCINGVCHPAGCDHVLNSSAKLGTSKRITKSSGFKIFLFFFYSLYFKNPSKFIIYTYFLKCFRLTLI